jgi:hypothetical protein
MMWMKNVAVFLCAVIVGILPARVSSQVRVNELVADPASDWDGDGSVGSKTDEWLEIVNVGSSTVDLSSYYVSDASGGTTWRYHFGGTLPAGGVSVVFGSDAVAWQADSGFPSLGLSLNNGGDTVYLFEVQGADTAVVDEYSYDAFAVLDDRAVGRMPDGAATWAVFDQLNPYSGTAPPLGTGCVPTPGASNNCPTELPTLPTTWGAVKDLYRD